MSNTKIAIAFASLLVTAGCSSGLPKNTQTSTGPVVSAGPVVPVVYLVGPTSYRDAGSAPDAVRAECRIPEDVENAAINYSSKRGLLLKKVASAEDVPAGERKLFITVDSVVNGRPGNGVGGRWVVSDLSVTSTLDDGEGSHPKTERCSAGLGANPFANFKACDRLERCSKQLGNKISAWLKKTVK